MRKMFSIVFYIVSPFMLLLTLLGFDKGLSRLFMASGSDDVMKLVSSDLYIRVALLIIFIILGFYRKWRQYKMYNPVMLVIFGLWLLSGRMVALFPDGRLIYGWYYIETGNIQICSDGVDCEKVYGYETDYERRFLWGYRIMNESISETIFTGPFIMDEVDSLFLHSFPRLDPKTNLPRTSKS